MSVFNIFHPAEQRPPPATLGLLLLWGYNKLMVVCQDSGQPDRESAEHRGDMGDDNGWGEAVGLNLEFFNKVIQLIGQLGKVFRILLNLGTAG